MSNDMLKSEFDSINSCVRYLHKCILCKEETTIGCGIYLDSNAFDYFIENIIYSSKNILIEGYYFNIVSNYILRDEHHFSISIFDNIINYIIDDELESFDNIKIEFDSRCFNCESKTLTLPVNISHGRNIICDLSLLKSHLILNNYIVNIDYDNNQIKINSHLTMEHLFTFSISDNLKSSFNKERLLYEIDNNSKSLIFK